MDFLVLVWDLAGEPLQYEATLGAINNIDAFTARLESRIKAKGTQITVVEASVSRGKG